MNPRTISQGTALAAMVLALVLGLVALPRPSNAAPARWADAIESGADHVDAAELARLLIDSPDALLVVDVRPADEFERFHLPGSVNLDVPALVGEPGRALLDANAARTVVLVSNGMTHPAQAWVELARDGRTNVRVLSDGLDGFVRDELTPPGLRGVVAPTEVERARFARLAALVLGPGALATPSAAEESGRVAPTSAADTAPTSTASEQAPTTKPADASPAQTPAAKPAVARLATDPARLERPTLVSTAWVAKRAAELVLVDTREKPEDYAAGHLPGALHVPTKVLRTTRDGVPDELLAPDELAKAVGALGIGPDTEVVAYGNEKLQDPAHFVLALVSLGHTRVAILEGGLTAWKAEARALSKDLPAPKAVAYAPRPAPGFAAVRLADVRAASEGGAAKILDVRPADAFRGEVSTEARAGHVPGSWNRPYTEDVAQVDAGLFWRPLDALRAGYRELGLDPKAPVIVTCRTGHQAAQTWFTLRYLLGYEDVRWYDGSWKEWAAHAELPAATGPAGAAKH